MESSKNEMGQFLGAHQLLRLLGAQSASTFANQVIAFVIPGSIIIALGVYRFPFVKHLDEQIEPEDFRESTHSTAG